jgi:2-amino-4-hydroxy-6-hydroxymethyldihydropteridine diphosphokinase
VNTAVVGVGSNINAQKNIRRAEDILCREQKLLGRSSFNVTPPIGYEDQKDFVNGAFLISTQMDYRDFKTYLKKVEKRLGRVRDVNRYGPRTIDLDVIVWNNRVVNEDYYTRDFVRKAVMELLPEIVEAGNFYRN